MTFEQGSSLQSHTLLTGVEEILLFVGFEGFGWTTRVGFRAKIWSTSICNERRDAQNNFMIL